MPVVPEFQDLELNQEEGSSGFDGGRMKHTFLIYRVVAVTVILVLVFLATVNTFFWVGKPIGTWEGQVVSSVQPYNDEYCINVMVDGVPIVLTNQFRDMFDVPQGTSVKFWGTIENFSFMPRQIHVDGIGW